MIISVCNTKGGVGKSTVAVHLAQAYSATRKTLLIDTDEQQTAAKWAAWRRESDVNTDLTTVTLSGMAVAREGVAMARDYAMTIVDAGGGNQPGLRAALAVASLAIVPVGASEFDTSAMDNFIELLALAKPQNPKLEVVAVLNRIARTKETEEVAEFLRLAGITTFNTRLHERIAYRRSVAAGKSVMEFSDVKAKDEMQALFIEVCNLLKENGK